MSQLAQVHATPGLAGYMAEVEAGLAQAVAARPGLAQEVAGEALAAGGKRLRPLLCFLTAAGEPSVDAGVAVELVHMATLVHDDLVDGARLRRGLPAAWSVYGADAAKAAGDYLYACAFTVLAATGDEARGLTLADAALCLSRGEAMQKLQTHDPDTPIDAYLERCRLKTGKLIEAACLLGSGGDERLGAYGVEPRHRVPDRRRHPRLRRRDAADREDPRHRSARGDADDAAVARRGSGRRRAAALAGGPLDGALVRVAATDALARSREAALDYAAARAACLGAHRIATSS